MTATRSSAVTEQPVGRLACPGVLESLSDMAGLLAHDFNNLLTPLLAYPALIARDLAPDAYGHELLSVIENTARDMVYINRQLQGLVPKTDPRNRIPMDFNRLIADTAGRLREDIANHPSIRFEFKPGAVGMPVLLCVEDVAEAVLNVCRNGLEAMEKKGGNLTVETGLTDLSTPLSGVYGAVPPVGTYAYVRVSDTGEGISPALRDRIFDPLYTTRKSLKRRGAGFGLTIAYRVVRDHQGTITVQSMEGGGSVFTLYFQVSTPPGPGNTTGSEAVPGGAAHLVPCTPGTLLIVDDEKTIQQLFRMIMNSALPQCRVDTVSNGAEAVGRFAEEHHAVILMDLHMPVMDGQQAFLELKRMCESRGWEMPSVVFCTGFIPPDSIREVIARQPRHALLSKPVTGDKLVDAVKARLPMG